MESKKSNQEDTSQQPTQSQPSKQEGFVARESEASMQELSDACEKTFREKGYDRRKEGVDRRTKALTEYEGIDRRKEGTDRRKEESDRRKEESDRRKEESDRRKKALTNYDGSDQREEGIDRRKEAIDRREEGFDRREKAPTEVSGIKDLLKKRTFIIRAGLIILLIVVAFCFTVPIPGLGIINDNEYIVTKVEGRANMKYQADYSKGNVIDNAPSFQIDGEWIPLSEGTVIAAGSRVIIETGAESTVDILMDDGMIVRVAKNSTVRLEEKQKTTSRIQVFVTKGRMFCNIVAANLNRFKSGSTFKMEVSTPNATCGVRGTIFSVDYQPEIGITNAAVLVGALNVTDPETAIRSTFSSWNDLRNGQMIQLSRDGRVMDKRNLSPEEMNILKEGAPVLVTAHTVFENIERSWRRTWWLTLYDFARKQRAENEMSAIITSVYQRGIIAKGTLPDTLSDKSIPGGDVKDPWGNSYLYMRAEQNYGLVISAGPDGKYNTPDDLYRFFSL